MQQLAKETRLVIFTTIFQTGSATTVEGLSFQPNLKPLQLVVTSSSTQCVLCTLPQQMKKQISLNIPPSCWLVSCVKLIMPALPDVGRHNNRMYNSGVCVGGNADCLSGEPRGWSVSLSHHTEDVVGLLAHTLGALNKMKFCLLCKQRNSWVARSSLVP